MQLWAPSEERKADSNLARYRDFLARTRGLSFASYAELWSWSVEETDEFWLSLWELFELDPEFSGRALCEPRMPGARWFEGARLNYAERLVSGPSERLAIVACDETGRRRAVTRGELRSDVARLQRALQARGVVAGDRVVGYLPNGIEALVGLLATASLGAIWASCPPEFGAGSVLDRLQPIAPKVLLASTGYRYGGKAYDRSAVLADLWQGLPGLQATLLVGTPGEAEEADQAQLPPGAPPGVVAYAEALAETNAQVPEFLAVGFDHPLWVLFSSGTTGLPKAIVHGHGGMLLEHLKMLSLHTDLREDDRFFWFSTTGWMMWNYLVSALALGTTVVLYDGSPNHPDLMALWRLAERERVTHFGTSAPFIHACLKRRLEPGRELDLSALRGVGSTGAPLSAAGFRYVYDKVAPDVHLYSISGGTDVCTAFLCGCPELPVYAGELQCAALGAKVRAYDTSAKPVVGQVGELVLEAAMPCMPLQLWNDDSGQRYFDSYFATFPGVWRHGDWITVTERGSVVVEGRSDATLNRGGVRMGTSEFYRVVEADPDVSDSLVVDTSQADAPGKLLLFVALARGGELEEAQRRRLSAALRSSLSPRHVPDAIVQVASIPRTLSGKKLEVPVKRILSGADPARSVSLGTLANPEALGDLLAAATQVLQS